MQRPVRSTGIGLSTYPQRPAPRLRSESSDPDSTFAALQLGQGTITYTTENRFLRYESLNNGRAAVIQTTATVPLDVSIDLQKAMSVTGGPAKSAASPDRRARERPGVHSGHLEHGYLHLVRCEDRPGGEDDNRRQHG